MEYNHKLLKDDLITKRLIDNSMSLDEAAKEIGVSKSSLCRLEKQQIPDVQTLAKLCN